MPYWKRTEEGMQKISPKEVDLSKPALIFLPSFITYESHNQDSTELYTGIFEKFLGGAEIYKKANIYSYSYNNSFSLERLKGLIPTEGRKFIESKALAALRYRYVSNGQYSAEVKKFAKKVVLSAMGYKGGFSATDHNAALKIADGMKNLTFVSNSYGSIFATLLDEYLFQKLQKEGFSEEDTKLILNGIVHIAACNVARDKERKGFCSIYFEAHNDELRAVYQRSQTRNLQYAIMRGPIQPKIEEIKDGLVVSFTSPMGEPELPDKGLKLRSYMRRRHLFPSSQPSFKPITISGPKGDVEYETKYGDGHDLPAIIHAWPDQKGHSDLFVRALNTAMSRPTLDKPVSDPMQLLTTQASLLPIPPNYNVDSIDYIGPILAATKEQMRKSA